MTYQEHLDIALGRAALGRAPRHLMMCGAVDADSVMDIAKSRQAMVLTVSGPHPVSDLATALMIEGSPSGLDVREALETMCREASITGRSVLIFGQDLDRASETELGDLIEFVHHANQSALPIVMFGAAGAQARKLCGDARSYAERMFLFFDPDTSPSPSNA